MRFQMVHQNFNVANLETSMAFYEQAFGLREVRRITPKNGAFQIVYLGNETTDFVLELTCLKDHPQKYDLGECEFHLAFATEDMDAAHEKHEKMCCICLDNPEMGIYFVEDPDGYWLEVVPSKQ